MAVHKKYFLSRSAVYCIHYLLAADERQLSLQAGKLDVCRLMVDIPWLAGTVKTDRLQSVRPKRRTLLAIATPVWGWNQSCPLSVQGR